MNIDEIPRPKPSLAISIAIFIGCTALMVYLRLYLFSDRIISLTYGLPLLICLWHRDRRLLWAMAVTFATMAAYKAFVLLPESERPDYWHWAQWIMQVVNMGIIGLAIHIVLNAADRLAERHRELKVANEELQTQSVELQSQSEELAKQNEEIQSQSEELAQQNQELQEQSEELTSQAEELQRTNADLQHREEMLESLLASTRGDPELPLLLQRICQSTIQLLGDGVHAAAIVQREGSDLVVRAHAGIPELEHGRWAFQDSFASIVMAQDRSAFVEDLTRRPELILPKSRKYGFRSIMATPIDIADEPAGAVEVYAREARAWTKQDFLVIEWVAAQASLIMESQRLEADRRRAEEDLRRQNELLESEVERRTMRLREAVNELEHFSYTITHDMRAPLRAMQGLGEILMEECKTRLEPSQRDYLRKIVKAAERMDALIRDALSYSKVVREQMPLTPVDAELLLNDIVHSYPALQAPDADIKLEGKFPRVLGNEAGLTQCFSNLLDNAVKFVRHGETPRVRVHAENKDGMVRLWFVDNGIGIKPEHHGQLFKMFHRLNHDYDGTGIGLALVRKVAERMGGKVGVDSEFGRGSRFWLELQPAV